MKILIVCTGNTCRSQMAEGFLRSFDPSLEVYSSGTLAEQKVNPYAVQVMSEIGLDISTQKPESVSKYVDTSFDYVITVCDGAKEVCPLFTGEVMNRLHIGFEDPAGARGSDEEILPVYRKVRDQIKNYFFKFYQEFINKQ